MNQWLMIRRLRAPAFLVLIGVMFLLNEFDVIRFHRSWPLLLILAGVLALAERAAITRVNDQQLFAQRGGGYPPPYSPPVASAAATASTEIVPPQAVAQTAGTQTPGTHTEEGSL